jgi:hypothetical protein
MRNREVESVGDQLRVVRKEPVEVAALHREDVRVRFRLKIEELPDDSHCHVLAVRG